MAAIVPCDSLKLDEKGFGAPEGWFLGPKAENEEILLSLIAQAIKKNCEYRLAFHPEDPDFINAAVKRTTKYKTAVENLRRHAADLFSALQGSAPIFSMRHQGHMLWDQALPAIVGYFAAMLYNQNNVAAEASPVTTHLEIEVGNDLCRMLGFPGPTAPYLVPWGHITCDGSVANIEALWAERNAKLFPLALRSALREVPTLRRAKTLEVKLLDGSSARVVDLDTWTALNLKIDDVVALPQAIENQFCIKVEAVTAALVDYSVQNIGLIEFYRRFVTDVSSAPVAMAPATRHYSWPKAGALTGIGQNNVLSVKVDLRARMDVQDLAGMLETCLQKHIPVISVVAVIGSTEESAVDPLCEILSVRKTFRDKGLDFAVHCDAAWGGYFNSMLRSDGPQTFAETPEFPMSPYVRDQYRALCLADSVTVDPHKAGYVPYPAGGLCYRNSGLRDMITLKAPVIFHSQSELTVGVYGVEGSKPGAAAAAVYLAHKCIPPTRSGYGKILGQCMWTSKRMYARLLSIHDERFKIVFLQELPSERGDTDPSEVDKEKSYIREHFVECTNEDLRALLDRDKYAYGLFMDMGSDQVILAYSFNFYDSTGVLNTSVKKLNALNDKVYRICSVRKPKSIDDLNKLKLILTSSNFNPASYGQAFVDRYAARLGLPKSVKKPISFLISTTMDPWTTDTPKGNFLEVIEGALRDAVHDALDELGYAPHSQSLRRKGLK